MSYPQIALFILAGIPVWLVLYYGFEDTLNAAGNVLLFVISMSLWPVLVSGFLIVTAVHFIRPHVAAWRE